MSELDGINEIEYFLSRMKDLHNHNAKLYAKLCTTMKCDIIKYIIEEMEIEEDEGDMIMELAS